MFKEQWIDQVHSLYQTAANIVGEKTNQASHKNINKNVRPMLVSFGGRRLISRILELPCDGEGWYHKLSVLLKVCQLISMSFSFSSTKCIETVCTELSSHWNEEKI